MPVLEGAEEREVRVAVGDREALLAEPAYAFVALLAELVDLGQLLGAPFDQADLVPVIQGGFFDAGELADVEELVTRRGDRAPMPSDWKWALPIRRPDKILAMARNYRAHAEEFKSEVPAEPVFFAKLAQCLVANDAPVVIPSWLTTTSGRKAAASRP